MRESRTVIWIIPVHRIQYSDDDVGYLDLEGVLWDIFSSYTSLTHTDIAKQSPLLSHMEALISTYMNIHVFFCLPEYVCIHYIYMQILFCEHVHGTLDNERGSVDYLSPVITCCIFLICIVVRLLVLRSGTAYQMSPPLRPCQPFGAIWRHTYSAAVTTLFDSAVLTLTIVVLVVALRLRPL